jgi:predicted SAM-dependent methyltransferase
MSVIPAGPWLNIGSGPSSPPDWINFDGSWQARLAGHPWLAALGRRALGVEIGHWPQGVRHRDIRRGLPYAESSVAVVYASHVLEHLHRADTVRFLTHVRQLLKPGGVCRVVVPDVHAIVTWYLANRDEPAAQKACSSSDLLMGMMMLRAPDARAGNKLLGAVRRAADLHEHKWMYDQEGLQAVFEEAGFARPSARRYLESVIPREPLSQVERADRLCDGAGVCVEAIR